MVRTGRFILALVPASAALAQQTVAEAGDRPDRAPRAEGAASASPFIFDDVLSATGLIARSSRAKVAAARGVVPLEEIETSWSPGAVSPPVYRGPGNAWTYADESGRWMHGVILRLRADAPLTVVEAYSATGVLIGRVVGGSSSTLRLDFPGSIGKIVVRELRGAATLNPGLERGATCPSPGPPAMLGIALMSAARRRRVP